MGGRPAHVFYQERLVDELGQNSNPDAYIASEHSYQKPPSLGLDPWPAADLLGIEGEEVPETEANSPATHTVRFVTKETDVTSLSFTGPVHSTHFETFHLYTVCSYSVLSTCVAVRSR